MFKKIGFFILIFFSSLNIYANEEVLSPFCNFKFTEYKKGPAIRFENIVPDPKNVCNNWKCGESIKVFSESAQGQNFFFLTDY